MRAHSEHCSHVVKRHPILVGVLLFSFVRQIREGLIQPKTKPLLLAHSSAGTWPAAEVLWPPHQ